MFVFKFARSGKIGWDEAVGFVVVAASAMDALVMVQDACGDEGPDAWARAKVTVIGKAKIPAGIVLRDFRAG